MTSTPSAPDGPLPVEATVATPLQVAPPGARFDPVTGADLSAGALANGERRQSFVLQPGEPVASFNLVSSLLPLASGTAPQTYRWALALGVAIPVVAGALGFLAFAFVAAAVVVPAIYVVYMYDVNEWEDQPVPVVLGTIGLAAALGVGFTFLWHAGILGGDVSPVDFDGNGGGGVRWTSLLVLVLLVPVVSEALKQVGPLVLARMPAFDDMIDGLTFGVAAGASFAAAETIVVNRGLFSSFGQIDSPNAGFWVSLILSAAIVKPIVYGAATGIAVASFSGLGAGYDGFKPGYARGLVEALLANIVFQGGLFVAARLEGTTGAVVGLVWGALVAGALVVRLRYLMHFAVLEAALEAASIGSALKDTARGTAYCPSCEMPLLVGANFCVACGTSVRAGSKVTRARNRVDDLAEPAAPGTTRPVLAPTPAGVAPRDAKLTAVVVGAVAATIIVAGVIGQAAASAAGGDQGPSTPSIELDSQVGSGPTTDPAPEPVPNPGPTPDPIKSPTASATTSSFDSSGSSSGSALTAAAPALAAAFHAADPTTGPTDDGSGDGGLGGTTTGAAGSVDIGQGVGFDVPTGYTVEQQTGGYAVVSGDGGLFFVVGTAAPTDIETMVTDHLTGLQTLGIQDLAVTDPEAVQVPTSAVVQCVTIGFQGVFASQQDGTSAVEGFAYYFLRQDGSGVTAFSLYEQGALTDGSALLDGYDSMLNSLVSTL